MNDLNWNYYKMQQFPFICQHDNNVESMTSNSRHWGVTCMNRKEVRLQREIHRLRTSPSLRLGLHITKAIRKPWLAPFLIITLPWIMLGIGFELLGWKSQPPALELEKTGHLSLKSECIVMFPTNGVGFGHFTRMLSVAKQMKKLDTHLEILQYYQRNYYKVVQHLLSTDHR